VVPREDRTGLLRLAAVEEGGGLRKVLRLAVPADAELEEERRTALPRFRHCAGRSRALPARLKERDSHGSAHRKTSGDRDDRKNTRAGAHPGSA